MGFWARLFRRRKQLDPAIENAAEVAGDRQAEPQEPVSASAANAPSGEPHASEQAFESAAKATGRKRALSHVRIHYRDAEGEHSSRLITIGDIVFDDDTGTSGRVVAFCHMRGAVRTFRIERIIGLSDPELAAPDAGVSLRADAAAFRSLILASAPRDPAAPFGSIREAVAHYERAMAGTGWIVRARSEPWAEYVGLHRPHRRGTGVMTNANVSLGYHPIFEDWIRRNGVYETVPGRSRDRPWTAFVVGRGYSSFARASEAAAAFEAAAADEIVKRA